MSISPFIFSSCNLPKLKAKQLAKSFPFLRLSAAQEATAQALGYSSWFECTKRGTVGCVSLSDQDAGLPVRVERYYHQAGVLMGIGITPAAADLFVRAWGLTGQPTLAPKYALPSYYSWKSSIERLESGEIDEATFLNEFSEAEYSKHPDIDRPQRICQGVILGPMGRYPHYALDPIVSSRIPIYLRGPQSNFHYEDDGDILAMTIPGFPAIEPYDLAFPRLNRIQYEWHYESKHPDAHQESIPMLVKEAMKRSDDLIVISQRWMPEALHKYDDDSRCALACLRGTDFAAFLMNKGVVDPETVIWFRDVKFSRDLLKWCDWLDDVRPAQDIPSLPVFDGGRLLQPSLPLYSYPFMTAPMSADEYGRIGERIILLPLEEDYILDGDVSGKEDF